MQVKLTKTIGIILFIMVILVVGASPVSAHAAMPAAADVDNDACGETPATPLCCLNSNCLVSHDSTLNLNLPAGRFLPNTFKIIAISQPPLIIKPAPALSSIKPSNTGPEQDLLFNCESLYNCRNSLTHEEPPLD